MERTIELHAPRGIANLVQELNAQVATTSDLFEVQGGTEQVSVDIAWQWTHDREQRFVWFANGRRTPGGGTHADGFRRGLERARSTSRGITAIVSVHHVDPMFSDVRLNKLTSPEVTEIVAELVATRLKD